MPKEGDFLGRGWGFPPTFDRTLKGAVMLEGEEDIRNSIEVILATQTGERVMQPGFGWKRDDWVFEALTTTAATSIRNEIELALLSYERRVNLNSVQLIADPINLGRVEIHVDYTVRSTNKRGNLVYPFYLLEV